MCELGPGRAEGGDGFCWGSLGASGERYDYFSSGYFISRFEGATIGILILSEVSDALYDTTTWLLATGGGGVCGGHKCALGGG